MAAISAGSLRRLSLLSGAAAGSAVLAQGSVITTDAVVRSAQSFLPTPTVPALALSGSALNLLNSAGQVGLAGAVIGGAGLAAGAIWGSRSISLEQSAWWKKLLFGPAVSVFNGGITYRQRISKARSQPELKARFNQGAKAGYRVGSQIGRGVGQVQGALLGGLAGWNMSGQAKAYLDTLLTGVDVPPLARTALPWMMGVCCLAAGQGLGGALGSVVGSLTGGAAMGVASGLYTACSPASS